MVEVNTFDPKKRFQICDLIKGVAIFLMLWGHCIQYCYPEDQDFFLDGIFKTIYSFHMPLLMLVSGFLFYKSADKYKPKELLKHKVKKLIWPIIGGGYLFFA